MEKTKGFNVTGYGKKKIENKTRATCIYKIKYTICASEINNNSVVLYPMIQENDYFSDYTHTCLILQKFKQPPTT